MAYTIAAVVAAPGRLDQIPATVRGLLVQSRAPDEIVVLDQAPAFRHSPATLRFLQHHAACGNIRLAMLAGSGACRACNCGPAFARSGILLYLRDCMPSPDLVARHLQHYCDPDVGAVGGVVISGESHDSAGHAGERPHSQQCDREESGRGAAACLLNADNFSVRREVFIAVGGWNEHLRCNADRDLTMRLLAAGHGIVYDPEARATRSTGHGCEMTTGTRTRRPPVKAKLPDGVTS